MEICLLSLTFLISRTVIDARVRTRQNSPIISWEACAKVPGKHARVTPSIMFPQEIQADR